MLRDYMFGRLLNIAIIPFEPSPPPSYQQTPLVREPIVLVGPGKDGLRADHPVSLSNIDGLKLVCPESRMLLVFSWNEPLSAKA